MTRFHVHMAVEDIQRNVTFYSILFCEGSLAAQLEKLGINAARRVPA